MPYATVNSIQLYYDIQGKGEPLLFIHGLGGNHSNWHHQVDAFANAFQTITLDLRGHGQSDKPNEDYSVSLFASDVAALIEQIAPQGVHIVGHSLGGMVAFQLACDFPALLKSLTILNSAPAVSFPKLKDQLFFYLRKFNVRFLGLSHLGAQLASLSFPRPDQASMRLNFITEFCKNDPAAYIHSLKAFPGWDISDKIEQIPVPSLILSADHDYTSIEYKKAYADRMPHSELAVIEDSHHISMLDQPEQFNALLRDFLERNRHVKKKNETELKQRGSERP